jgi:hypothetical protein
MHLVNSHSNNELYLIYLVCPLPRPFISVFAWNSSILDEQISHHHWQNSHFWAIALEDSAMLVCHELDHPVFTPFDFTTVIFLQSEVISFASKPQPGGPGLCIYVTGWPSYVPRHQVPSLLPSTTRRAMVEVFWCPSTWEKRTSTNVKSIIVPQLLC